MRISLYILLLIINLSNTFAQSTQAYTYKFTYNGQTPKIYPQVYLSVPDTFWDISVFHINITNGYFTIPDSCIKLLGDLIYYNNYYYEKEEYSYKQPPKMHGHWIFRYPGMIVWTPIDKPLISHCNGIDMQVYTPSYDSLNLHYITSDQMTNELFLNQPKIYKVSTYQNDTLHWVYVNRLAPLSWRKVKKYFIYRKSSMAVKKWLVNEREGVGYDVYEKHDIDNIWKWVNMSKKKRKRIYERRQ